MTDNGFGRRNKLLIMPINTEINRCTNFHWWINSAGARSSNGAACHWHSSAMIFLHRSRSHRQHWGSGACAIMRTLCIFSFILLALLFLRTKITTYYFPARHSILIGVYNVLLMRLMQFRSNVSLNNETARLPNNEWIAVLPQSSVSGYLSVALHMPRLISIII